MVNQKHKSGFSLIEVNLAIFVIAVGMLTLFSLFPAGLRQVETAQSSTQTALLADYILSTLQAESLRLNAQQWSEVESFETIVRQITGNGNRNTIIPIRFPEQTDPVEWCRYLIEIEPEDGDLYSVALWVQSGEFGRTGIGGFKSDADKYYIELFYSGMH